MVAEMKSPDLEGWAKDLGKVDFEKTIKRIHREVGMVVVAGAEVLRRSLASRYPSYGKVTIKPSTAVSGVAVNVGPKTVGYAGEFGAYVHPVFGRFQSQSSFGRKVWPTWAGSGLDAGYLVYPTLRAKEADVARQYEKGVAEALRPAFPEGSSGSSP